MNKAELKDKIRYLKEEIATDEYDLDRKRHELQDLLAEFAAMDTNEREGGE